MEILNIAVTEQIDQLPEGCRECPRVKTLSTERTQAIMNRDYISSVINADSTVTLRNDAIEEVKRDFPDMSEDWIIDQADKRVAMDVRSDATARNLMKAGELLNLLDETIETTTSGIQALVRKCAQDGCPSL